MFSFWEIILKIIFCKKCEILGRLENFDLLLGRKYLVEFIN